LAVVLGRSAPPASVAIDARSVDEGSRDEGSREAAAMVVLVLRKLRREWMAGAPDGDCPGEAFEWEFLL